MSATKSVQFIENVCHAPHYTSLHSTAMPHNVTVFFLRQQPIWIGGQQIILAFTYVGPYFVIKPIKCHPSVY